MGKINLENLDLKNNVHDALDIQQGLPCYYIEDFGKDNLYYSILSFIVYNRALSVTIEQKFNKSKRRYTEKAENHPYYSVISNSYSPVDKIELGLKLLGLFADEGDKILLELIKKGWPNIFNGLEKLRKKGYSNYLENKIIFNDEIDGYVQRQAEIIIVYYFLVFRKELPPYPLTFDLSDEYKYGSQFRPLSYPTKKEQVELGENEKEVIDTFKEILEITDKNIKRAEYYFQKLEMNENYFNRLMRFADAAHINPYFIIKSEIDADVMNDIITMESIEWFEDSDMIVKDVFADIWTAISIAAISQEYYHLKEKYIKLKEEKENHKIFHDVKELQKQNNKLKAEFDKKDKMIEELKEQLQKEKDKNRKNDSISEKAIKDEIKKYKNKYNKEKQELEKENTMLRDMIEEMLSVAEAEIKKEEVSFDEMLKVVRDTPDILYVCCDETGAGKNKIEKIGNKLENLKFFIKETNPVPTKIDYIFFDYHIMNHSMYSKIKEIGKRKNIPMFNIQSINPEKNIEEMYWFIISRENNCLE